MAIAVWLACATLPAETSCYFNLTTNACLPSQKIVFTEIEDETEQPTMKLKGQ
jgi:hypothetical protein